MSAGVGSDHSAQLRKVVPIDDIQKVKGELRHSMRLVNEISLGRGREWEVEDGGLFVDSLTKEIRSWFLAAITAKTWDYRSR